MNTVFVGLLILASAGIIATTLLMEPKTKGAGMTYGQETNVFGKSAHRSRDRQLQRWTILCGIVFAVSLIGMIAL